jgi:hypothetical protein
MTAELCMKCQKNPADLVTDMYVGKRAVGEQAHTYYTDVSKRRFAVCDKCIKWKKITFALGALANVLFFGLIILVLQYSGWMTADDFRKAVKSASEANDPAIFILGYALMARLFENILYVFPVVLLALLILLAWRWRTIDPVLDIASPIFVKDGLSILSPEDAKKFGAQSQNEPREEPLK